MSGALLALSFPKYGHPAVAWLALVPLLVHLADRVTAPNPARRGFVGGWLCGVVYFAGTIYWTGGVMARYGGIDPALAAAIAGLLIAFLALFPGVFGIVQSHLTVRYGPRAVLLAPFVWTATELGRTWLFGGFPWALVGYSQTTVLPVAQLASVTGVYGLSALIVFVSAAAALAVTGRGRERWVAPSAATALVAVTALWGSVRIEDARLLRTGTPLQVGLVQGNVPQDRKWDPAFARDILSDYLEASRAAADRGARLIIWPESATPFTFDQNPRGEAIRMLARERRVWILFGSDEVDAKDPSVSYNSAFLIGPDGSTAGVYRKVQLVPFGEYVPFRRLLFFAKPLVQAVGDFAPGEGPVPLPFAEGILTTAICYEVVYPALIREGVLAGSTLLTTITNDAWFGRSSAPYQHFEMAAMRAIEQGRYLARSANTGISGIVDPYGRVIAASGLFESAVIVEQVRLIAERTIYARIGDVVAHGSVLLTLAAWASCFIAGRRLVR
ncbi:MAG TPA: apolipoprotein N-acyltransferase [Vicinamibacterales bacterium]|nr:apolipoprotein N-acyltransferase [Vicinamibacterales bacterium]